ncbi:hypothetical protein CR513_50800, partial [Mucuna pruriens]
MFINTLPSPYYNKVVGNVASNFADLVVAGERIELDIIRGKFAQLSSNVGLAKRPMPGKKKGETNAGKGNTPSYLTTTYASPSPTSYVPPYQLRANAGSATNSRSIQQGTRRPLRTLTPIPMPYIELLP